MSNLYSSHSSFGLDDVKTRRKDSHWNFATNIKGTLYPLGKNTGSLFVDPAPTEDEGRYGVTWMSCTAEECSFPGTLNDFWHKYSMIRSCDQSSRHIYGSSAGCLHGVGLFGSFGLSFSLSLPATT